MPKSKSNKHKSSIDNTDISLNLLPKSNDDTVMEVKQPEIEVPDYKNEPLQAVQFWIEEIQEFDAKEKAGCCKRFLAVATSMATSLTTAYFTDVMSLKDDTSSDNTKAWVGAVGGAVVSSAGLFYAAKGRFRGPTAGKLSANLYLKLAAAVEELCAVKITGKTPLSDITRQLLLKERALQMIERAQCAKT